MRKSRLRAIAGLLLFAAAASAAHAETPPKFAFVRELQRALRADDRSWLAERMNYPLRHHGRITTVIRNKADFMRDYATVVSDRLRAVILAQDPDKPFENWQGVMIGDGAHNIWLRESGEGDNVRYEIVTINDSR